jgi:hypothetical protein
MSTISLNPTQSLRLDRRPIGVGDRRVAGRSTVRLTRRGRLVVFVLGLMVAVVAGFLLASASTATEHPESTTTVQVGAGETLWDIARDVAAEGRTAEMVAHIKELNGLDSGSLAAGQELRVPVAVD